jgi:hypothetical protein
MRLDPSESINNMGSLRVDVLDAQDLPAADSNGKSDPYAKFELNEQEVFKTKTQKKTLNPQWNEFFEVPIPSRTAAKFRVQVYDWDFGGNPDFLGGADINLGQLDPFKPTETKLILDGKSGSIRLRLLFRPGYVTRTRQGTSTFAGTFASTPGRIVTGVAGAPLKGGMAVAGVVGSGVGKGTSFLKRGFKGKKDDDPNGSTSSFPPMPTITTNGGGNDMPVPGLGLKRATGFGAEGDTDSTSTPTEPTQNGNGLFSHGRTKSIGASSVHSTLLAGAAAGTATFTVVSASGFPPSSDVYVVINQIMPKNKVVGKTKHHKSPSGVVKFDETFKWPCSPDAQFQVQAKEQHTFSSDEDLGEAMYVVDETGLSHEKEIKVGSGTVVIKSNFVSASENLSADSPKSSNIRRSFLSKREGRSRETTPNP